MEVDTPLDNGLQAEIIINNNSTPAKEPAPEPFALLNREPMYCAEQIRIPPQLPDIMKNYTKFIIRERPENIIEASAAYFTRMAKLNSGTTKKMVISVDQLESMHSKLLKRNTPTLSRFALTQLLESLKINADVAVEIINMGQWGDKIPWVKFWSLAVASATGTLLSTMEMVIRLLSDNGQCTTASLVEVFDYLTSRDPNVNAESKDTIMKQLKSTEKMKVADLMKLLTDTLW